MKKYNVECRKSYNDDFDNYVGDYIECESEEEAIELCKQWLIDNGMKPEEVEDLEYKVSEYKKENEGMVLDMKKFESMKAENGTFEHDGRTYILLQQAYISDEGETHFEATAICENDTPNEYGELPVYNVYYDITCECFDELEDLGDACDWNNPSSVEKTDYVYDLESGEIC